MKKSYLSVVLALSASTSGCFLGNNAKVKVPSPGGGTPAASRPAQPPPSDGAAAETVPASPSGSSGSSAPSASTPPAQPGEPKSTETRPSEPIPLPAVTSPPKPPVARTNPPAPSISPVPQLAEILTPSQRSQYQAEYTQDVARSNEALKQAASMDKSGRKLSATQRQTVARIQTFLRQAGAAHNDDIATAVQLSRRADLLAQELLKGLK